MESGRSGLFSASPLLVLVCALAVGLAACDDTVPFDDTPPPREPSPAADLLPDSLLDYIGQARTTEVRQFTSQFQYFYDEDSGPMCIGGKQYVISGRSNPESNDVFIFLQGGGACWSEVCIRTDSAPPGIPSVMPLLNTNEELSPFGGWNLLYMPYCDGSLFAGDADYDDDEDGELDRQHRGVHNLSAAFDIVLERWPNPDRIAISGLSAGGFGTVMATAMARKLFPSTPIYVFNDSGVGVAKGDVDPDFVGRLINEWNASRFIPPSCTDCLETGHLTAFLRWQLQNDPLLRVGAFSYYQDAVIGSTFLRLGGETFQRLLIEELPPLAEEFPDQYNYVLMNGSGHTTFGITSAIRFNDIDLTRWIHQMLDHDPEWTSYAEPIPAD